jgi:hypothetical protein
MGHLVPCSACGRHVFSTERGCPFCGVELPAKVSAPAPAPRIRLGRAAMFAAGATLVGVTACKDGTVSKDAGSDADRDTMSDASGAGGAGGGAGSAGTGGGKAGASGTGGTGGRMGESGSGGVGPPMSGSGGALYGAPPVDAGGIETGGGVLYGAPPVDGSSPDLSSPGDASQDRGVIAIYGASPISAQQPAPKPER